LVVREFSIQKINKKISPIEYVALVACLIAIGALGTDLMLPALNVIGLAFGVGNENDVHLIITAFFLGMAGGQLIAGPLSDRYGRKPIIHIGYGIFVLGCILSIFAQSWAMMLTGRVLQGFGAAAPRVVTVALVRDEYEGRAMARIMSVVMAVFITVPIIAPALGLALIQVGDWQATFVGLAVLSVSVSLWFHVRQPETLAVQNRRSLLPRDIWAGLIEVFNFRVTLGYTLAAGLIFGMFIGYLGSAQQIFQDTFKAGNLFVVYFAIASLSFGVASLINAKLVMRFGMRRLTGLALVCLTIISFGFWLLLLNYAGVPSISLFLTWQLSAFFFVGIIFGNINALCLEPLGHLAGLGAAFTGSLSTFISLPLAWFIGNQFDGTVFPLVAGFSLLSLTACAVVVWTEKYPSVFQNR